MGRLSRPQQHAGGQEHSRRVERRQVRARRPLAERAAKNIRWVARLGSTTYGSPVVAGGTVFCATNNGAGWLKRYPAKVDLGCLLCFAERDGRFGWQLSREKLAAGRAVDYPEQGICCAPLVEGKRLWVVTNRCEVVCLDTRAFTTAATTARTGPSRTPIATRPTSCGFST